jgi:serine/threonine-protein kinase RsbW
MEMQSLAADIELELRSEPASVGAARHAAARLAADVGAPEDDVRIAVSEAVGNAVVHGYRGRRSGPIILKGWVEGGRLLVVVVDRGIGMSPNPASAGLGMGLPLIARVVEDLRVEGGPEGTTVSMSFAIESA